MILRIQPPEATLAGYSLQGPTLHYDAVGQQNNILFLVIQPTILKARFEGMCFWGKSQTDGTGQG